MVELLPGCYHACSSAASGYSLMCSSMSTAMWQEHTSACTRTLIQRTTTINMTKMPVVHGFNHELSRLHGQCIILSNLIEIGQGVAGLLMCQQIFRLIFSGAQVASLGGARGGTPRVTPSRGVIPEGKNFFVGKFTKNSGETRSDR